MGRSEYPAFVRPTLPDYIKNLESEEIVGTISAFLKGKYDPRAEQFSRFLDIGKSRRDRATKELKRNILATQGGQRIYGGAAGKQLNRALIDKVKDDLDREQEFLWDSINQIIDNRKLGLSSGQSTIEGARNYSLEKAALENQYNSNAWESSVLANNRKRSSSDKIRSFMTSLLPNIADRGLDILTNSFTKKKKQTED